MEFSYSVLLPAVDLPYCVLCAQAGKAQYQHGPLLVNKEQLKLNPQKSQPTRRVIINLLTQAG